MLALKQRLTGVFICRLMVGQYVTVHGEVISHVNISRTQVEDGGLYTCSATNRAGTASHSTRLNVYGEAELTRAAPIRPIAHEYSNYATGQRESVSDNGANSQ